MGKFITEFGTHREVCDVFIEVDKYLEEIERYSKKIKKLKKLNSDISLGSNSLNSNSIIDNANVEDISADLIEVLQSCFKTKQIAYSILSELGEINNSFLKDEIGRKFLNNMISILREIVDDEKKLLEGFQKAQVSSERIFPEIEKIENFLILLSQERKYLMKIKKELIKRSGMNTRTYLIGYGEISVVFSVERKGIERKQEYVFKKLPYFRSTEQVNEYINIYNLYHLILHSIGIDTPNWYSIFSKLEDGYCVYALQEKVPKTSVGNVVLHQIEKKEFLNFFEKVLEKISFVDDFNNGKIKKNSKGEISDKDKKSFQYYRGFFDDDADIKIGLDAQISNWAFMQDGRILYLDTSTPLIRKNGKEQLDVELFLKAVPLMFSLIIKLFLLDKVLDRYYNIRTVVLDLIANFIKEKKPEYIPELLHISNRFLREKDIKPIEEKEVFRYYKEDATIWRFFQFTRRVEKFITEKIFRREYKVKIPEKIER